MLKTLKELFSDDFCVKVDCNKNNVLKVMNLFKTARDLGMQYTIVEAFEDTWMAEEVCCGDYAPDYWIYFGLMDNDTYISDGDYGTVLSVEEFEKIVLAGANPTREYALEIGIPTIHANLVVSGGVVIVNYKNGKQYRLEHNGKATFDIATRTVVTERNFTKDGQKAYESVTIDWDNLESVQSDANKLINMGDNQVAFVILFNL